jgi:hypothetical protein
MGWQKATGYGRRSLVETTIGRYKQMIGSKLRARGMAAQQGEVAIAVEALNRMIRVAKPFQFASHNAPRTWRSMPPRLPRCTNALCICTPNWRRSGLLVSKSTSNTLRFANSGVP